MSKEKDSDRIQRVVDAMGDDYEPRKPSLFEPEIFEVGFEEISRRERGPRIHSHKEYIATMGLLLYLAENPSLMEEINKK